MTRQGAGSREQGEKGFKPYLLFFTHFGYLTSTYLHIFQKSNINPINDLTIVD